MMLPWPCTERAQVRLTSSGLGLDDSGRVLYRVGLLTVGVVSLRFT